MTFCDVVMEEATEAASEDVEMEEASLAEDIDPRITGADSQTSVEELESFLADPDDPAKETPGREGPPRGAKGSPEKKRRPLNSDKYEALKEEVSKLLQSNFIREARYPKWVLQPRFASGRHCLGISCLASWTHTRGTIKFPMYPPDEEHTSFVTDKGLYCYKVMPFGLKNAGATYQRLVNKMFADQLGSTMEVYVDDMLVKESES
ncbi:Reverse transcriptase domain-containing protein [Abeliophyllum distichum]|uniref:Reverse transcriptase domain-containing protein n=1 Tax=Abeliophyllum distichum TaxID=126358 RepID=A0ABD1NXQ4_9LAMI